MLCTRGYELDTDKNCFQMPDTKTNHWDIINVRINTLNYILLTIKQLISWRATPLSWWRRKGLIVRLVGTCFSAETDRIHSKKWNDLKNSMKHVVEFKLQQQRDCVHTLHMWCSVGTLWLQCTMCKIIYHSCWKIINLAFPFTQSLKHHCK